MDRAHSRMWFVTLFFIALGVSVGFVYRQLRGSEVQLAQGRRHYEVGKFDLAREYFAKAAKLDPKNADAWHDLGMSCKNLGKTAEAAKALAKATELRPKTPSWWFDYAETLQWLDKRPEAEHAWQRVIELLPPDDARVRQAKTSIARNLAAQGQTDRAIEILNKLLAEKDDRQVRFVLAEVLAWGGRFQESAEQYRRSLDSQPENLK